ncbi:hypothetical protein M406DRAFT_69993 [Cryphonectria parasitica EP155]|uniref:Uncharacterized protein n=1 Tax=Cryphonectria parasitica (strain ATCC 38755 / EP155) TaxID=660469 RepID=A0A9P5CS27_CRYP1|nr:uncharacterized protein M406DRAFT_69993 [Cryphonectria parasitica EP155]KAF3767886.1 hypothetical protein M406DRAFT_69993 [Cryphonectria parasitica EP155]
MASVRPSTAGGPSTRRANTFDKRMSKDDMFFNNGSRRAALANQTMTNNRMSRDDLYIKSRMASMSHHFHVPVHGVATTTPEYSPDHPVIQEVSIPVRMQTPESVTSGDIPIGMALGSPTRHSPPDASRWQAQFPPAPSSPQVLVSSEQPSPAMGGPGDSLQRKKTGRRKLFGLFGGGGKKDDQQGHKAAGRERGLTLSKHSAPSTAAVNVQQPPKTPTRSYTQSDKKTPKHKPIVLRSNTMPVNAPEHEAAAQSWAQVPRTRSSDPRIRPGLAPSQSTPVVPPLPLLNVQIPETKLERYSVMFSDVLKQGPKQEPAASLLARRQATLERLKTISQGQELEVVPEDTEKSRPRRATSPQPSRETLSPSLSVFPIPPTGRAVPGLETPTTSSKRVARSNTSPGRLPSPTQQVFDTTRARHPPASHRTTRNLEVPNPFEMHPPLSGGSSGPQEPIYPTDTTFHFGHDKSGLILDSPTSMDSHEEIIVSQPSKPTLHEPQWQVISPAPSTSSSTAISTAASGHRGRSASAISSSTHITKPSSDLDASDAALQNAVEVSIARQISISRQQRDLLRPLQTRRDTGERHAAHAAAAAAGAFSPLSAGGQHQLRSPLGVTFIKAPSPSRLGRDESIRDVQSSTPTLVHQWDSPIRKSTWAVVESD